MKTRKTTRFGIVLLMALGVTIVGCDSGSNEDNGTPPELFSSEAFTIDTDLFQAGASKGIETSANFVAAALRVWPVSLILNANLVIPAAITASALQDSPEFDSGVWVWSTTTVVNGNSLTFDLTGDPVASGVNWSLIISSSQPILGQTYDRFELVTAQTRDNGTRGSWQLFYKLNGTRTNVLNADFVELNDGTRTLTFSIPAGAAENAGDSVEYSADGTDRRFFWQQVAAGQEHDVQWNAVSKEGSITATNYNDGIRGCWNASFEDVACSQ